MSDYDDYLTNLLLEMSDTFHDDSISVKDAIKKIERCSNEMKKPEAQKVLNSWKNKRPIIEAQRMRGTWTKDNACEFCGFQPWYERNINTLSFCPNCGADMRGEHDENI